jgi:hypothetical protein
MGKAEDWVSEVKAAKTAMRRKIAKELRDAEYAIKCLEAEDYKGKRRKKGCNGMDKMCEFCTKTYLDNHPEV